MEWSRVKTILICVFLAVNLFLLRIYIKGSSTEVTVDSVTIDNTAAVLLQNNIAMDKKIIPQKSSDMPVFSVTNSKATAGEYANILWENSKKSGGDYFNPSYCREEGNTIIYTAPEEGTLSDVKRKIKKSGILDHYSYKCSESEDSLEYKMIFNNMYIEDVSLSAVLKNKTVTITAVNCLGDSFKEAGYCTVKTAPEILISFAAAIKPKNKMEVVSMEKAYAAGNRNGEIQTMTASPVWKITAGDGAVYYIDMRNGDLLDI